MTNSQIQLLKRCIYALRQKDDHDDELVEVGRFSGVDPRTAESLVEAGILVYDLPRWANECTSSHVRFPTLKEIEEKDD